MSHRMLVALVALTSVTSIVRGQPSDLPVPLDTPKAQASYGIGRQLVEQLSRGGIDPKLLNMNALMRGIQDAASGKEAEISQEQFQAGMMEIQQAIQKKLHEEAQRNLANGPKFLEKYKSLDGVQALPSGLLYKVVGPGSGPSPKATDQVKTHYRGRLIDRTEFDSSYKRGTPAVFPVNQVIAGWTEALQKMKVGAKWQLVIPPELGYGENGSPPLIGPHAVLIFDIELLEILPPQAQPQ